MEKISLLLPTRNRPDNIKRFWDSVQETADSEVEVVVYIDSDDESYNREEMRKAGIKVVHGRRRILSETWNQCYSAATGDILGHMGDDIIFRTKGWDTKVRQAFAQYPDRIVFVYGDDGGPMSDFGTHGFIHRNWVEAVGYFVPPYFSSDYNDTWLNDVAKLIGRHHRVDILTEHMHPAFNKAEWDKTHQERMERHRRDNVDDLYRSHEMQVRRQADAEKLREAMQ